MGYKFEGALKKSKWIVIIGVAIWIALSILLSAPLTVSLVETADNPTELFNHLVENIANVGGNFAKSLSPRIFFEIH